MRSSANVTRLSFFFSMLPAINTIEEKTAQQVCANLAENIDTLLEHKLVIKKTGHWKRVWGPCIHSGNTQQKGQTDYIMFMARNSRQPRELCLSIMSRNPLALFGWQNRDCRVNTMVKWPFSTGKGKADTDILLAGGAFHGFEIIVHQMQDQNLNARDFLKQQYESRKGSLRLYITGHGPGGTLCTLFGLYLEDTRSSWDPNGSCSLTIQPFGCPTAGNRGFADYVEGKINGKKFHFHRHWNRLDPAARAWNASALKEIPSLYEPEIPATRLVRELTGQAIKLAGDNDYVPICDKTPPLKIKNPDPGFKIPLIRELVQDNFCFIAKQINQKLPYLNFSGLEICQNTQFLTRVVFEHILAYFLWLKMTDLLEVLCSSDLFRENIKEYFACIITNIQKRLITDNIKADIDLSKLKAEVCSVVEGLL